MKLYAPESYWATPKKVLNKIAHGCGPGRGWKEWIVPENVWGLPITLACKIHDFMYYEGACIEDKNIADRAFLNNMLRIVEDKTRYGWLKFLRRRRVRKYYLAVKHFGGPAFWKGKNKPWEERDEG